ncbi:hypothetical protein [Nitrososphaera viennensis]|uniref:Uncharacterized protein n=2 Tax=Nitrososphaera viennensis TaxID=1034015 RepID=A0A060HQS9_9ARCH|nr:hypothetical protein [Nitrososphaera viennensis]AIC15522.1 exported protein of unknown function [Nitrososphaera viennensis EN76]UVS70408.1 hypothetical protein NWT39_06385 [Nitrososphaera viennensis]
MKDVQVSATVTAAILLSAALAYVQPVATMAHGATGIGVLVYTHGNPANPNNPDTDNTQSIKQTLETRFGTPAETVTHMPYNWDDGLQSLDSRGANYAIFLYTDMFGPDSTVIHNVTRGAFGGISEYNYCPGPVIAGACNYMGESTAPASTVSDAVLVFAEPARPDHPILKDIFVKQAREVSTDPANEIVVLVGHGARSDTNDNAQKAELATAAAYVEDKMNFAGSLAVTAREDWPTLNGTAVANAVTAIESMMNATGAQKVVLVPATGASGFGMVANALQNEGITFVSAPKPLPLGLELYKLWASEVVAETIKFIQDTQPTQSTITPYWERTYSVSSVSALAAYLHLLQDDDHTDPDPQPGSNATALPSATTLLLAGQVMRSGDYIPIVDFTPNYVTGHLLLRVACDSAGTPAVMAVAGHIDEDANKTYVDQLHMHYLAHASAPGKSCVYHAHVEAGSDHSGAPYVTDIGLLNTGNKNVVFRTGNTVSFTIQSAPGEIGEPYSYGPGGGLSAPFNQPKQISSLMGQTPTPPEGGGGGHSHS